MDTGSRHVASFGQAIRAHVTSGLSPTSYAMAIRNAIGVVLPLMIATAMHNPTAALIAGVGTLNVAMSDRPGLDVTKVPRMLWTVIGAATAVFIGSLVGWHLWLAAISAAVLALVVGLLSGFGPGMLQGGTTMVIAFLVASNRPHDLRGAAFNACIVLVAGCVQTLLSTTASPAPARNPDGHALDRVFRELAGYIRDPEERGEVPAAISITQVAAMQQAFAVYRSPADRAPLMLCIHRVQSELMALVNSTEELLALQPDQFDRWQTARKTLSETLVCIGRMLVGTCDQDSVELTTRLARHDLELLGARWTVGSVTQRGSWRQLAGVLTARLEETARLAEEQREKRISGFQVRALAGAMRERARATVQLVRLNVRSRSPILRHAIRLSVCVAIAGSLASLLHIPFWYWSPVTVVAVLRPYYGDTVNRMTANWIGTFAGLVLGTTMIAILPDSSWVGIAVIALYVFLQRLYGASNIAFGMAMIAAYIVALLGLAHVPAQEAFVDRAENVLLGGAIAVVAFLLWPTWEQLRLRDVVAACIDRYRDAFRLGIPASIGDIPLDLPQLEHRRTVSRAARASAEDSIRRTRQEPDISDHQRETMDALLVDLRMLVWVTLRLEAYARIVRDQDIDQELLLAFREFCRSADRALQRISVDIENRSEPEDVSAPMADAVAWMRDAKASLQVDDSQTIAWYGVITQSQHLVDRVGYMNERVASLASIPEEPDQG